MRHLHPQPTEATTTNHLLCQHHHHVVFLHDHDEDIDIHHHRHRASPSELLQGGRPCQTARAAVATCSIVPIEEYESHCRFFGHFVEEIKFLSLSVRYGKPSLEQ